MYGDQKMKKLQTNNHHNFKNQISKKKLSSNEKFCEIIRNVFESILDKFLKKRYFKRHQILIMN